MPFKIYFLLVDCDGFYANSNCIPELWPRKALSLGSSSINHGGCFLIRLPQFQCLRQCWGALGKAYDTFGLASLAVILAVEELGRIKRTASNIIQSWIKSGNFWICLSGPCYVNIQLIFSPRICFLFCLAGKITHFRD